MTPPDRPAAPPQVPPWISEPFGAEAFEFDKTDFETQDWLLRGAERLRESLCGVPFYAKKAAAAKAEGDEMAYWVSLHSSASDMYRP